jgi:flagellar biosynthesis/type III secretory pathway protein FliH
MSHSARRLAATVTTQSFDWQAARNPLSSQPVPLVFAEASKAIRASTDPDRPIEARELHLPSVAAERIEAIEHQAYHEGYTRGQRTADEEMERRLEDVLQRLRTTLDELGTLGPHAMRRADREMIHLAVAMAERIVRGEVRAEPATLLDMARAAIERLGERVTAVIHLNPTDLDSIVSDGSGRIGSLDVVADSDLPRGGCMIRTNLGAIDAGIDAQMRELLRAMLAGDGTEEAADGPVAGH